MSLKREIEVFDRVNVSPDTGETDIWDKVIFPNVIRKREIDLILKLANRVKPKRILDFGCGAGWLSKVLASEGYWTTGIDTSSSLVKSATNSFSGSSRFIVGDCMNLPFRDESFDLVVGIAILHHLQSEKGLAECHRVIAPGGSLILLEPNKYNPIAAAARRMTPVDTQTPDERPFSPQEFKNVFNINEWKSMEIKYLFPYSAGFSQIFRRMRIDKRVFGFICPPLMVSEILFEKVPILNRLSWVIVAIARKA